MAVGPRSPAAREGPALTGVQESIDRLADQEGTIELDRTPPVYPDDVDTGRLEPHAIVCTECGAEISISRMSWRKKAEKHRDRFGPEHDTFARNLVERLELPPEEATDAR